MSDPRKDPIKSEEFVSGEEARQGIIDFIRNTVGPRQGMKPDLVFAIDVIQRTIPKGVLRGEKLSDYKRAMKTLWDIRDRLCQIETTIGMYWPVEQAEEDE